MRVITNHIYLLQEMLCRELKHYIKCKEILWINKQSNEVFILS